MNHTDIKFKFDFDFLDDNVMMEVFDKAKHLLNFQFDDDFNVSFIDRDVDYQFKVVSNLSCEDIEIITDSFFNFTFEDIFNVFLYKFLVLRNNEKYTILAIINSSIFDYISINDFYELFNNLNTNSIENNLSIYYGNVKNYLNSSDFDNDLIYWKNFTLNTTGYVKFYNLKSNKYKCQKIEIDKGSVSNFVKTQDCSLFDFYASIFSLYLSRIDRQKGCLLKTNIKLKRNDPRVFNKTILKVDFNNDNSFEDYLHQFNSIYEEAVSHTKFSIENYLDETLSYYSVYDFSDLNENISIYNGEDSVLTLNIYEDYLELVYNSDSFSEVYIEHMANNIENLINDILNSPDQIMGDIDILSSEEKSLLSDFCKGKSADFDKNKYLSHAFRENAINYPDAIAVDDGMNKVTFGELEKSSNSIAYDLHEVYGIGFGSRVALMLPRSYHFPELVLALNKIGATFIPIDLFYPVKRIEYMLNMSQAEYIVTTEEIANSFDFKEGVICIEDLNDDNDVDVDIVTRGDDLFTIIFTSGTTGLPKGVMVSNNQIPGVGISFKEIFNYSRGDVIGHYLGFTFVAGFVLYAALYYGGCCRIFNEKEQKDSLLLIKELKENHMNSLILPPSIGIPIYENEDLQLDYLVLAGAKLNELSKKEKQTKLINFYGTTEIICGVTKEYSLKDVEDNNVPLGRPVANSWIYILDENNNQMPIGVPGEICVSNNYMSPGYLNNLELTEEVFIDNPYSTCEDNKRMYRTGDIGFYNFDGEIEIIGREDDQLSVRGFRIESGEILNIMKSFNEISDIYLDVDNDTLTAYYTTNNDLDIDEVKEALKINLPYYMVPSLFIELDKIPLSATGKIDKSSLKTIINNEDIEIADEVLQSVVDAFKEVLNLDFVLIDDDFVALGGNSLTAMKLQLLLKERLNVYLSSNELIGLSTPKSIADYIKFNLNIHSTIDGEIYTFDELCPLSESQLNVYLDESANNMGTAYNNPFKIEFNNSYSVDDIKSVLLKLFEVFPILKARVLNNDGVLSFIFDAIPEIAEGSLDVVKSFVRPFELDKHLSRFLIIKDNNSVSLFVDFHHLIFDGTSLNIFLSKFLSILEGDDVDFVDKGVLRQVSFEELVDSDYMDAAHEFFEGMLEDRDEVYDLLASVDGQTGEFEFIDTFEVDDEFLNSFLQNHSLTYNQFLTSVFAYTLSRFGGSEKVLFNLIEDGRGHVDLSESVGMFVRTLPVLMDCKNQEIDSFFKYSSDLINSVMMYDLYPFRVLAKDYDLNSNILFQYSHNLFSDVINKEDLRYTIDELKHDLTSDLSFFIFNNDENKLSIRVTYSSMYSKDFIKHFVESYKLIMHEMTEAYELRDINYTSSADLEILDSYNQTERPLVHDDILDVFNDNLAKWQDNKLVSYNDVSYSYAEGAYIIGAVGRKLADLGVKAQDCVSFLVPRSELYMFSVLGIMSVGAVYVPLDDTLPDERIEFILKDTNSSVVIVGDETYNRAKELSDGIAILNISDILKEDIGSLSSLPVVYGDVASILYTSGTTGIPKGVKITRKSILNVATYYVDTFGLNNNDVYGLYASIGFDAGVMSIFKAIYSGACLSIVPEEIRYNMHELNKYFIEQNVTHTIITTPVGKLFMNAIDDTSLDYLFVGGDKLGKFESPERYQLVDEYGPTEGNNFISSIINSDKIHHSSVGKLNYNSKAYILDNEGRRVPCGAVGELYLAGYQIADGYLNREGETKESFISNMFDNDEDYDTLYRTGDMVRVLSDGSLAIVGRRDGQVKIRGNRVELSEVESVIRELDYVSDVTVQTIKDGINNELVAYVVASHATDDIKDSVCGYVSKYKPDYMIPSFVIPLDNIPLTVNGKVNKRALPEVDLDSLSVEYVAPTNETEKSIVEAFENVFNRKNVGIYDDFVRLGGDSLMGIKLLSSLKDYNITLADVLSLRTPYAISNKIVNDGQQFDLNVYSLESGCPLNEPQLNVYLDILANEKVDSYIIPAYMAISKEYVVDDIIDALNEILNVHPILGMCVSDEFEVPYLVKGSKPQILVESNVDEDYAIEFIKRPFDLNDCLCRFLVIETDEGYNLFASFHHIVFDGFSRDIFIQDLQSILDGESVDVDDTFLKASAFSQQIHGTGGYDEAGEFYQLMLEDSDDVGVLLDSVLPDGPSVREINLDLDPALLKLFLDKYGVSQNVLFTSVFAYTLSRFVGSDDVLFNITEAGRDRFGNFKTIGMYVNTLPILVDCKNQDISSFMDYMSNLVYDVMKYNYYPFRVLANNYNISSNIIFHFLPDWILDYDYYQKHSISVLNAESSLLYGNRDLIADFIAVVNQKSGGYNFKISYSDKYSGDFVDHFLESYKLILHQLLNADNLIDINHLTTAMDIELFDEYNQTDYQFDYDDVLDAFNDNLSKFENDVLVGYEDNFYTYGEGAFIVSELADRLSELNVFKQDFVALFVPRSEWFLLASMGVLSMGGVYVPIDANYPDERIILMIDDSRSKVVIVTNETEQRILKIILDNNLDVKVLNVSSILGGDIGSLNHLNLVPVDEEDIACVLYTSGTTGTPKGTLITRKAVNNFVSWYVKETEFTSDDVYGMHCSYVFDMHTHALYSSVITGGSLYIVPEDIRLNLKALNDYFVEHKCTHTYITSQVGKLFAESGMETSIRLLCFGGMKLGELNAPDSIGPFESYGPSENLAISTSIFANERIHHSSIGRFISNVKGYVLDGARRRVPLGAVGELYLAGSQLTPGYLNREDENDGVFFDNSFDDEEGYERIYRTGDMVRFLPDGTLGIVGRRDSQVKIRGNRVELSEVETVIREMDYVEDVTVQTVKIGDNNELVAYVVSNGLDEDVIGGSIQEYVADRKPDYMIPSFVIKLDEIPLNVNGKVDKRSLPDVDRDSLHAEYVAPTNETEMHIVNAFEHVFNQEGIGLNDDFVRLGGDSIVAIRVISLLEKNDISCNARDILNYKTPYLIAQNVQHVESISYDAVEGTVDLLPIQEYFFNQNNSDNFSQYYILKSNEKLDLNILQESFDELCNVHDMLRASYSFGEDDEPVQEILPLNTQICEITEYDILEDFDGSLKDIFVKSVNSLSIQNNLIAINLLHHNDASYLMFVIHHLIIDGLSWNILITDLTYIYNNLKTGKEVNLLRPYTYKKWVDDVKNLVNDISPNEKQHWVKINDLLDDSTIKGETNSFLFDIDAIYDVNNLLMLSEEEYWALSIARAYKKTYGKDMIFQRETYGRDESIAKLNRTIGWFTSQYPLLVNTNNNRDDVSLMNDVYSIKTAFKEVDNLGLNYYSLIYTTNELEFKNSPVTFNFLGNEFSFKNELFESVIPESLFNNGEIDIYKKNLDTYGITFNIFRNGNSYNLSGYYAGNTYIGDEFATFIENIKNELEFIGNYRFKDNNVICCLSESQLGIYLDEKMHEKGSAYVNPRIFECDSNCTIDELKEAIHALIQKHPILRGRVLDTEDIPLLICDSYPSIEIVNNNDYSDYIKPFDLDKYLASFLIVDTDDGKSIVYYLHHIISDATTLTLINKGLEQALMGKLDDEIDLGFVYDSRDSFESKYDNKYNSAHKFFQNNFADIDEVQYLLTDVDGKKGGVALPIRSIRENVELFTKKNNITVSNLLNAVFAYTYSRFTGSDKVYYNFTEHGRHENYLQDAWGMFIRTIPIIVDCENKSISDYADYTSDLILKSMTHSIYPFRLLAREFNLSNSVLFEYNHDLNDFEIGEDIVVRDDVDGVSDFLCIVNDLEDGFVVSVIHSDKFSQYTATQFVKAFKEILIQFLEKENLADIDYISHEDIEILDTINQTEHSLVYDDVLDAFNDNLSKYPVNNLVLGDEASFTYGEGAYLISQIQSLLKEVDVGVGDKVSVFVDRNHWVLLSNLSVLSLGATYVPIDENYPDNRIIYMIEKSESKAIITTDTFQNRVNDIVSEVGADLNVINISSLDNEDVCELSSFDYVDPSLNGVACILFTSGTTGNPKAVQVGRYSIVNMVQFYGHNSNFTSDDVYGVFASVGFDVSLQHYVALLCGGAVTWVPNDIRLDIAKLNGYFVKYGVTHTIITTQVSKLFVDSVENTSIKNLCAVGEKLGYVTPPENYAFVDVYGPTEATSSMTSINVADKTDVSSVGRPDWNTKIYLLDAEQRRIPFGAVGELYISGYQVSRGYLNNPEANSKAFFENPFNNGIEGYERMYKTGDVAHFLPDGTLGFIGRNDSQVKIRGNRLELTEVEAVIREIDYVDDVTVQTIKHDTNNELVAYVVVSNDLDGNELKDSICDYVNEYKPEYMVPSFVIKLDEIPLNVNGKVDKRALPDVDRDSLHAEYVAPRDENEKAIVEAFEKALDLENVSVYDDFIRLGGDSLTAIKLLSYIDSDDVSMADIFAFRTPEAIAKNITDFSFDLDIYSLESGYPLNAAQINVFADVVIYNKRTAYQIPGYIVIPKEEYDLEDILDALDELLNVHPILSMRLSDMYEVNDENDVGNLDALKSLIMTAKKFGINEILNMIKTYGLNVGGLYNMLRTIIRLFKGEYPYMVKGDKPPISIKSNGDEDTVVDFFSERLDIYGNLSKFMIIESEESYNLFYLIHHIIFDATSAGVFKHNLQTLLDGGSLELDDTFLKAAAYTHQIKNTERFDEADEFYEPILSDIDDVGILEEDNLSEGYSETSYDLEFDKIAFKSFLNNAEISENALFTGVFAYTLSQFVGKDKVLFTMIENGRDRFNENFIGMTSNVMPLVVDCKDQSIDSYIEDVADMVYGVSRYSYYPILLLYMKYNFEVHILFQFVPNWIADDFVDVDVDSSEIVNRVLNTFSDSIAEFFVQVYQNGDDYRLVFSNSNKYSDEMLNEFKDTYLSILSNIINADMSSNLSSTFK